MTPDYLELELSNSRDVLAKRLGEVLNKQADFEREYEAKRGWYFMTSQDDKIELLNEKRRAHEIAVGAVLEQVKSVNTKLAILPLLECTCTPRDELACPACIQASQATEELPY